MLTKLQGGTLEGCMIRCLIKGSTDGGLQFEYNGFLTVNRISVKLVSFDRTRFNFVAVKSHKFPKSCNNLRGVNYRRKKFYNICPRCTWPAQSTERQGLEPATTTTTTRRRTSSREADYSSDPDPCLGLQ